MNVKFKLDDYKNNKYKNILNIFNEFKKRYLLFKENYQFHYFVN